ncbi:MAG: aminotransferase class I/II-fold pyridoxal phosphate-dependent enzyme, partial [Anaerolineae bacterium]
LSKAFGTIGGFVAGPYEVITYLRYHAPTYIFTKALPLVVTEATSVALELLEKADDRRAKLWQNTKHLQQSLRNAGFHLGNTQSPITPVLAEGTKALYSAYQLREKFGI